MVCPYTCPTSHVLVQNLYGWQEVAPRRQSVLATYTARTKLDSHDGKRRSGSGTIYARKYFPAGVISIRTVGVGDTPYAITVLRPAEDGQGGGSETVHARSSHLCHKCVVNKRKVSTERGLQDGKERKRDNHPKFSITEVLHGTVSVIETHCTHRNLSAGRKGVEAGQLADVMVQAPANSNHTILAQQPT